MCLCLGLSALHDTDKWCLALQVTGPGNATVQYFNYAQNSTSSYQLLVQWDDAYRGNVTVDLQTNRWV